MINYQFQKSMIQNPSDQEMQDKLTEYIGAHMPELEFESFRASYAVKTFTFRMKDPSLAQTYKASVTRNILDAVLDTNGTYVTQNGSHIVITVPREDNEIMYLGNGIDYLKTIPKDSDITCYIGEDIDGNPVTLDFNTNTHMLIAGQNNSGKSTCIHDIIMSLMSRYDPNEVLFCMLDPKSDLIRYQGLPSVIGTTDNISDIVVMLKQINDEMERRQVEMKAMKLSDWNRRFPAKSKPHIMVIFDEIDTVIGKQYTEAVNNVIRTYVTQIAKKGRSSGIHLILASQRPIKANLDTNIKAEIKARVALRLDTLTDSRIMLNQGGAEKLKKAGDAYVVTDGTVRRAQIAYASYDEIDAALYATKAVTPATA